MIVNNPDLGHFNHDQSDDMWGWIKDELTEHPGYTPGGPFGAAYALMGIGPFAVDGLGQRLNLVK